MKTNISKSLLAAAALLGSAHFATAQIYSTNLGAGNTNYGNFSLASGGYNAIYGGYGNHALGWSCTIGTGSFNFLTGLQNVTAGNFNFVAGASNQPAGAYNVFAGQNNRGTGNQNLVFGSFLDAGALNGSVILSDGNPFSIRTAGARFTNTTADSFTGIFNGGYAWRTNSGQVGMGIGANAGLFIKPNVANSATEGNPAFVGINTPMPTQALDVVGNGAFTGTVSGSNVNAEFLNGSTVTATAGNFVGVNGVQGIFSSNVGIGSPTPSAQLEIIGTGTSDNGKLLVQTTGGTFGPQLRLNHTGAGGNEWVLVSNGSINQGLVGQFHIVQGTTSRFVIATNGAVGIGTTNPTQALLVVNSFLTNAQNTGRFFDGGTNVLTDLAGQGHSSYSIFAANRILAGNSVDVISDARIKQIEGRSDAVRDLDTLLKIQITDYKFKDTLAKGNRSHKKVIAQQVEQVYPQAVNQLTDVVPDIYKKAGVKDGWVQLATDLKVGERVRLIGEKAEGIHEVLEVKDGSFRTTFQSATGKVFVYGREVKDFRTVDYEAIAMLNVSATQEIARKLEAKDAEIAKLTAKLAALEARDAAREARLARLEAAGTARPARAIPAVLKLEASAK